MGYFVTHQMDVMKPPIPKITVGINAIVAFISLTQYTTITTRNSLDIAGNPNNRKGVITKKGLDVRLKVDLAVPKERLPTISYNS